MQEKAYASPQGRQYDAYIHSPEWSAKRDEYWAARGRSCKARGCGERENLHVHHHTYIRLRHELLNDLVGLCERHHEEVHSLQRRTRISLTRATERVTGLKLSRRSSKTLPPPQTKTRSTAASLAERHKTHPPVTPCACLTCKPKKK